MGIYFGDYEGIALKFTHTDATLGTAQRRFASKL